jgi:hypothetical protein
MDERAEESDSGEESEMEDVDSDRDVSLRQTTR